jgi:uncharacterized protein (DUF58 family)
MTGARGLVRLLVPRRTIRPTREGWWMLGAAVGLGFAAVNTANNLLYLLTSLVLGLIVVSGVLSERTIRGLRLSLEPPEDIFAQRRTCFVATLTNTKRWSASYSIMVEVQRQAGPPALAYVSRLGPGGQHLVTWEDVLPRRGRQPAPAIRVSTIFPFGLFRKSTGVSPGRTMIVFPQVGEVAPDARPEAEPGQAATRRRGRGVELQELREYREGDDPRLIHWPSSARAGTLTVRELAAETTRGVRIVLVPSGDPGLLEPGLSAAASLAHHLLRTGARLELVGPGLLVAARAGRAHERAVLTALALYEPEGAGRHGSAERPTAGLRDLCVRV